MTGGRAARLVAFLLAALLATGCRTSDGLEANTVDVRTPDRRVTLDVDGCGRDGDVVVLGASSQTVLLQLLLQIDGDEVSLTESGVTVTLGTSGTLGAGAGQLIGAQQTGVGSIESASVTGDRIRVVADAVALAPDATVTPGRIEVTARCTADVATA